MENRKWYAPYISEWDPEEPSQYPEAFARTIPIEPGKTRLLDVGCGSGIIGIFCLMEKSARSVTFMDKEPSWLDVTRHNVELKIKEGAIGPSQVSFSRAADLSEITYDEVALHDLVAFNPPQMPQAYVDEETRQRINSDPIEQSFRRGGQFGLDIARKFFDWYASLPLPKPDAVILLSSFLGRQRIEETIHRSGLRLRGEPAESDATLRPVFSGQVEVFSQSPAEVSDRMISKVGAVWHKKLLTFRLSNK